MAVITECVSVCRSLCSRLRPDIRDRQSDRRQTRIIALFQSTSERLITVWCRLEQLRAVDDAIDQWQVV